MNWYKAAQKDDIFGDLFSDIKPSKEVSRDPAKSTPAVLTLYRGFNVDLNKLQKSGNGYVLSPTKSEQGVLWFTHNLINGYNPIQYVTGRGSHLLTYPLQCIKHTQTIHNEDGSSYEIVPPEINAQTEGTENCRFYRGYELTEGWFFSYKMEKFIICDHAIIVTPDMIKENVVTE